MIKEIENKTYQDSETGIVVDFAAEKNGICVIEKSGERFVYGMETAVSAGGEVGYLIDIPESATVHRSIIEAIAREIGFYVSIRAFWRTD